MGKELKPIVFSGGGSGGSGEVEGDSLRTTDNAELLIGICEGPIVGLEDGEKSFLVGETPLVASDGSKNFDSFVLDIKHGDSSQDETVEFKLGGSSRPTNVGQNLEVGVPVTRQTQSGNINYIDIRLAISGFWHITDKGNTRKGRMFFKIEFKRQDESEWHVFSGKSVEIYGKCSSTYVSDYRIIVNPSTQYVYEIRITREGESSVTTGNGLYGTPSWLQFEEVVAENKEFKNTALAHINIQTSDQLDSLPQFSGIYKTLIIKVPSNYDPEAKTYDGVWDGTFKMAYTDNPAWCLYDLIMNDRYGTNAYYPVVADKWDFYEAGQFCDELVSDGAGGTQPRYTLNMLITDAQSGPQLVSYVASAFNAIIYEDSEGLVRLAYEKNEPAVHIFSIDNVTPEGFTYSFSDPTNRYNAINVGFINPNLNWVDDQRSVTDEDQIETWGRIPEDFSAIGCIYEGEAIRRARYRLCAATTEVMTVSFTTNRVAQNVNLYDTISIVDPLMEYSVGGRIIRVSSDRLSFTLRDPIFIEAGVTDYTCSVQTTDGILESLIDVRDVGYVTTVYLQTELPETVPPNAVITIYGDGAEAGMPKPFRVVKIEEDQEDNERIKITATEINRNKQTFADTGFTVTETEKTGNKVYPQVSHVTDISISYQWDEDRGEPYLIVVSSLDYSSYPYYTGAVRTYIRASEDTEWDEVSENGGDIIYGLAEGTYEFKVMPQTQTGAEANFETAPIFTKEIKYPERKPSNISGLIAVPSNQSITLMWTAISDSNLSGYEVRLGTDWDTATVLATNLTQTTFIYTPDDRTQDFTFLVKAKNTQNLYSETAASASASLYYDSAWSQPVLTSNTDWGSIQAFSGNSTAYKISDGVVNTYSNDNLWNSETTTVPVTLTWALKEKLKIKNITHYMGYYPTKSATNVVQYFTMLKDDENNDVLTPLTDQFTITSEATTPYKETEYYTGSSVGNATAYTYGFVGDTSQVIDGIKIVGATSGSLSSDPRYLKLFKYNATDNVYDECLAVSKNTQAFTSQNTTYYWELDKPVKLECGEFYRVSFSSDTEYSWTNLLNYRATHQACTACKTFQVAGSPTLTETSASGFSSENYISKNVKSVFNSDDKVVIDAQFTTGDTISNGYILALRKDETSQGWAESIRFYIYNQYFRFSFFYNRGTQVNIGIIRLSANTTYYARLVYDPSATKQWAVYIGTSLDSLPKYLEHRADVIPEVSVLFVGGTPTDSTEFFSGGTILFENTSIKINDELYWKPVYSNHDFKVGTANGGGNPPIQAYQFIPQMTFVKNATEWSHIKVPSLLPNQEIENLECRITDLGDTDSNIKVGEIVLDATRKKLP